MRRLLRNLVDSKVQGFANGLLFGIAALVTLMGEDTQIGVAWFVWVCHLIAVVSMYPPEDYSQCL